MRPRTRAILWWPGVFWSPSGDASTGNRWAPDGATAKDSNAPVLAAVGKHRRQGAHDRVGGARLQRRNRRRHVPRAHNARAAVDDRDGQGVTFDDDEEVGDRYIADSAAAQRIVGI